MADKVITMSDLYIAVTEEPYASDARVIEMKADIWLVSDIKDRPNMPPRRVHAQMFQTTHASGYLDRVAALFESIALDIKLAFEDRISTHADIRECFEPDPNQHPLPLPLSDNVTGDA